MNFDCPANVFDARRCDECEDGFNRCDVDGVNRHRIGWQRFDERIDRSEFVAQGMNECDTSRVGVDGSSTCTCGMAGDGVKVHRWGGG